MADQEVFDAVAYQLGIFQAIASALDVRPNHVKPHGALYNMAVREAKLADAIARAIESVTIGRLRRIPSECLEEYISSLRMSGQPESAAALVGGDRDGTKRKRPIEHLPKRRRMARPRDCRSQGRRPPRP